MHTYIIRIHSHIHICTHDACTHTVWPRLTANYTERESEEKNHDIALYKYGVLCNIALGTLHAPMVPVQM